LTAAKRSLAEGSRGWLAESTPPTGTSAVIGGAGAPGAAGADGGMLGNIAGGGVGGIIVMVIVASIKSAMAKKLRLAERAGRACSGALRKRRLSVHGRTWTGFRHPCRRGRIP